MEAAELRAVYRAIYGYGDRDELRGQRPRCLHPQGAAGTEAASVHHELGELAECQVWDVWGRGRDVGQHSHTEPQLLPCPVQKIRNVD